ncbi:putative reverse transcriptase domain-containing protein [Tanacetum coccineum]
METSLLLKPATLHEAIKHGREGLSNQSRVTGKLLGHMLLAQLEEKIYARNVQKCKTGATLHHLDRVLKCSELSKNSEKGHFTDSVHGGNQQNGEPGRASVGWLKFRSESNVFTGESRKRASQSLACIKVMRKKINDIRVVRDFPEVFLDDLLGFPHVRELEFRIAADPEKLCNAHVLALPDGPEDYVVYCDASKQGFGCVLMQRGKVIAYASRQLKKHENNYTTHDLELGAVVFAFKIWRHYLYGMKSVIYTDHKSLQYIFRNQIRVDYAAKTVDELLSDYECEINYTRQGLDFGSESEALRNSKTAAMAKRD